MFAAVACDDADPCTTDACDDTTGACTHDAVVCDDGLACTTDSCDPASGDCLFVAAGCGDGDVCTTDRCDAATGSCAQDAVVCNDGAACTTDGCDAASGCVFSPLACDDGDPCTTGSCREATGGCVCEDVVCDDGLLCTVDFCDSAGGGCVTTPVLCSDGIACTADSCDPATGSCVFDDAACGVAAYHDDDYHSITVCEGARVTVTAGFLHTDGDWFAIELCPHAVLELAARFNGAAVDLDLDLFGADGTTSLGASSGVGVDEETITHTAGRDGPVYPASQRPGSGLPVLWPPAVEPRGQMSRRGGVAVVFLPSGRWMWPWVTEEQRATRWTSAFRASRTW